MQKMKILLITVIAIVVLLVLSSGLMAKEYVPGEPLKAGFIYVGPIGDLGWSNAHDNARLICEDTFPWLETVYVESVAEGDEPLYIDKLIMEENCDVIFTTSFGFMDGTLLSAQKYPDKIFAHCSGFKRNPNMMTYMADFYQIYYLNGLIAGALTKTNKTAYVGAFPIPELKRHMGAFAVGVKEAKPKAEVNIRWIYEWFSPTAAKEATEALLADGCDVFAFTEDSPTVVQVAAESGYPSFGHYSPMYKFSPEHVVSGQIAHWEAIYLDFLAKIYAGAYTAKNLADVDYWWLLKEKAVEIGAKPGMLINPAYEKQLKETNIDDPIFGMISVYDLVMKRLEQMSDPSMIFDPFNGPIYDRDGNLKVPEGSRMSVFELTTMDWAVDGIVGPWE
jgi:simple sugar transport system substrate-binding protein